MEEQFEVVNQATERCFGSRGGRGWGLWGSGPQLALVARDSRTEYLKLVEAGCSQLPILDGWVDDILDQLKAM